MRRHPLAILGFLVLAQPLLQGCFSEPATVEGSSGDRSTGPSGSTQAADSTSGDPSGDDTEGTDATSFGSSGSDVTTGTVGDSGSSTGERVGLDCAAHPPVVAEPPEVRTELAILIDPATSPTAIDWTSLQEAIDAAVSADARVAVLLSTTQGEQLDDPACLSCGSEACQSDITYVKVEHSIDNPFTPLTLNDLSCVFDDGVMLPPTRHYWLLTDDLSQTPPAGFTQMLLNSGGRLHVASPGGNEPPPDSALADLVEATFGTVGSSVDSDELFEQMDYISAPRYACAWAVDPIPDTYPFFVLRNTFLTSQLGKEGLLGVPVDGFNSCETEIDDNVTLETLPIEFFYEVVDGNQISAACPLACAFIQSEPAEFTSILDVYCEVADAP